MGGEYPNAVGVCAATAHFLAQVILALSIFVVVNTSVCRTLVVVLVINCRRGVDTFFMCVLYFDLNHTYRSLRTALYYTGFKLADIPQFRHRYRISGVDRSIRTPTKNEVGHVKKATARQCAIRVLAVKPRLHSHAWNHRSANSAPRSNFRRRRHYKIGKFGVGQEQGREKHTTTLLTAPPAAPEPASRSSTQGTPVAG